MGSPNVCKHKIQEKQVFCREKSTIFAIPLRKWWNFWYGLKRECQSARFRPDFHTPLAVLAIVQLSSWRKII
jgi:hypothetical protein